MLVVLLGMKHCGKTTVGRRLAQALGCDFFDADDLTVEAHRQATGELLPFRELYRRHGREVFQHREAEGVGRLLDRFLDGPAWAVLALGGGTIFNGALHPRLAQAHVRMVLQVGRDELLRRIRAGGVPAFLDADDLEGSFDRLLAQRAPAYEAFANVAVDLGSLPPPAAAEKALHALTDHLTSRGISL